CAADIGSFGNTDPVIYRNTLVARKHVDAGLGPKTLDNEFGDALSDPIERSIVRQIFERENQNGAGVCMGRARATQCQCRIYEDAPQHTAIILKLPSIPCGSQSTSGKSMSSV